MWRILCYAALVAGLASPAAAANDERPGQRFVVDPLALPQPHATPSVANAPKRVVKPGAALPQVPEGFAVNVFANGLTDARWLAVAPNGDVFLAEANAGKITVLRDADGDGVAELRETFVEGLSRPHGMAFRDGALYVGDVRGLWRINYKEGDLKGGKLVALTKPGAFGSAGGHWTRNLAVSRDGQHIYVAIGSTGNVGEEASPAASVQQFNADGSGQTTFASGLRNPVGIAFYPGTDDLYVAVNERDGLGDGLVPDYLTRIAQGQFFGWPYAYIGKNPDPDFGKKRPDMVAKSTAPDVLFESHSAALGLVFYDRTQFPQDYRGDAFVGLHGSWNSAKPTGYKVVRVDFKDGRPVNGGYENFVTGFWETGTARAEVWGRPVGLALAADGSLLIADDVGQTVWRVSYKGKSEAKP